MKKTLILLLLAEQRKEHGYSVLAIFIVRIDVIILNKNKRPTEVLDVF